MRVPVFSDVVEAHRRIETNIRRTAVVQSPSMNRLFKAELFFKCEHQQRAGAFKFRGASNAVLSLSEVEARKGVATHSSGNHAAALALAASMRGIPSYIVMPSSAPEIKVKTVESFGGQITFCEPTLEARETTLEEVVAKTGATFIHPYNNFEVICGQGTAAIEMIEETGTLDVVMAPVGGGGLLSGTSLSAKHLLPGCKVIAGEPQMADDACRSFKAGYIIPSTYPDTIADGLRTSVGELPFTIIQKNVDDIFTAFEESIKAAMVLLRNHAGILAEPSSAVPLAAVMENRSFFKGKRIGIIISGGNLNPDKYEFLK
jgi:threonine dehydratase